MNRTSITHLVVALTIAAAIGAQVPMQGGTAMAADLYKNNSKFGKFVSAGLIGAIFWGGRRGSGKTTTTTVETPPVVAVKDCEKAEVIGDPTKSILDNVGGMDRFTAVRGLVGDCDEVLNSLRVDEPLTFLAPENGGLGQVSPQTVALLRADKNKLCEFLKDHILIGRYRYEDLCRLADGKRMLLLSGNTVLLGNKNGKVTLNGVEVAPVDIAASNGWAHPLRGVFSITN